MDSVRYTAWHAIEVHRTTRDMVYDMVHSMVHDMVYNMAHNMDSVVHNTQYEQYDFNMNSVVQVEEQVREVGEHVSICRNSLSSLTRNEVK
jgi:hypothetical protein